MHSALNAISSFQIKSNPLYNTKDTSHYDSYTTLYTEGSTISSTKRFAQNFQRLKNKNYKKLTDQHLILNSIQLKWNLQDTPKKNWKTITGTKQSVKIDRQLNSWKENLKNQWIVNQQLQANKVQYKKEIMTMLKKETTDYKFYKIKPNNGIPASYQLNNSRLMSSFRKSGNKESKVIHYLHSKFPEYTTSRKTFYDDDKVFYTDDRLNTMRKGLEKMFK